MSFRAAYYLNIVVDDDPINCYTVPMLIDCIPDDIARLGSAALESSVVEVLAIYIS